MKIPDRIQIIGRIIRTDYDAFALNDNNGIADFENNAILLKKRDAGVDTQSQEIDYLHEVVHFMLESIGYKELNNDEKFVNGISELVYQVGHQIKWNQNQEV